MALVSEKTHDLSDPKNWPNGWVPGTSMTIDEFASGMKTDNPNLSIDQLKKIVVKLVSDGNFNSLNRIARSVPGAITAEAYPQYAEHEAHDQSLNTSVTYAELAKSNNVDLNSLLASIGDTKGGGPIPIHKMDDALEKADAIVTQRSSGQGVLGDAVNQAKSVVSDPITAISPVSGVVNEITNTDTVETLDENKGAIVGTVGGFLVGGPVGAAVGAGAGIQYDQNQAIKEEQEEANKEAEGNLETAKEETGKIIDDLQENITLSNEELLAYGKSKGIEIEEILLNANEEAKAIALKTLDDIYNAERQGNDAQAGALTKALNDSTNQLIEGQNKSAQTQIDAVIKAGDIQVKAEEDKATELITGIDSAKKYFTPWYQDGQWASNELKQRADELTRQYTLDDFQVDPSYQFELTQGQNAIINRGSAIGVTGNTARDLVQFSQDYASTKFNNASTNFYNWQRGVVDFYNSYIDRGFQVTDDLANLELARGDVLANRSSNIGNIRAGNELTRGDIESNRILNVSDLDSSRSLGLGDIQSSQIGNETNILTNYLSGQGGIETQNAINTGEIKANTLQRDLDLNERVTTNQQNADVAAATGNINALTSYTNSANNLAINQAQIDANYRQNMANIGTNLLTNYLFLSNINRPNTGGTQYNQLYNPNSNTVAGPGSANVNDIFDAAPGNMVG